MKKIKILMNKSLTLLLCILMVIMNFSPLFLMNVKASDSNINGTYGIVYFRTKGCDETTNYYNVANGKTGYTNGCYGADGAFLGYNSDRSQVKFKMSGVTGWVNVNDVKVIDYLNNFDTYYTSNYTVKNGILIHYVMSDIYSYSTGSKIELGPKPSYLEEGKNYWSYDGHYFYDANVNGGKNGYKTMIDDYVNNRNTNAINKNNPYYNYYQYITHRTQSNYTDTDIANYLRNTHGINGTMTSYPAESGKSLLYGEQTSFVQYQNEFGANLGLVLGLAQNESANGTSYIAYNRKNLFGHSAFDSSPGASADAYLSVAQSIYAHDRFFVSEGFLDPCDGRNAGGSYNDSLCQLGRYNGGHVGDKASGLNVEYASDPYWGEKTAQFYYTIDDSGGMQDYNKYTIAIKIDASNIGVYKDPTIVSTLLYKTGNTQSYPVIVLGETTGETINGSNKWYKIQTDPVLNDSRTAIRQDYGNYDFNNNYGYVPASYFTKVNQGREVKNKYTITFDPNEGMFTDGEKAAKRLTIEQNVIPKINNPVKDNDIFMGWTPTVMGASGNVTYKAMWKNTKYDITFDANGGKFSDGTTTNKTVKYEASTMPSTNPLTRDGYTFKGWTPAFEPVTTNKVYTAIWEKNKVYYDITFDANGGKFSDGNKKVTTKYEEGELPTITVPTRSGYVFDGWDKQITSANSNTTYKAKWKAEIKYDITFNANGGKFSDNKENKVVSTIEGAKPTIETPTRDGYIFKGWNPELTVASSNTTYEAIWEEGTIENTLTKKDGEFYLNELKWNNTTKKYDVSGYLIMLGVNNAKDNNIKYDIILKNKNTGNEYAIPVDRWLDNPPFDLGIDNDNDYSGSWFKGSVTFDSVPQGDYDVYMRANDSNYYTKTVFSNLFNKSIGRRGQTDNKGTSFYVELGKISKQLVLSIRNEGLITTSESQTFRNMTNDYDDISFVGNLLKVVGTSYNYGGDYSDSSKIKRQLILENIDTYERFTYDIDSTNKGSYAVSIGDNVSKEYAWYNKAIDITNLPKGTYTFIVHTKTSNVEDYGEISDKFAAINKAKQTINGITYEVTLNKDRNNRIELKVY